jgi:hypothetical protein
MSNALYGYEQQLANRVNGSLQSPLLASIVLVLTFMYSTQLRPSMPKAYNDFFARTPVQIVILTLALSAFNKNPALSFVLVAVVFAYSHYVNGIEMFTLLDPQIINIDPNCEDATYADILAVFDGDVDKLENFARQEGLPVDKAVKDNAPLVASFMVNNDISVTNTCNKPFQMNAYDPQPALL